MPTHSWPGWTTLTQRPKTAGQPGSTSMVCSRPGPRRRTCHFLTSFFAGLTGVALHRLATKFALHPLALEDAIHISRLSRSSATWYPSTLFVRLMSYEIDHEAVSAEAVQHGGRLSAFRRACRRLLRQSDDLAILQDAQARQGTDEFTWSKEATKSAATDAASLSEKEDDVRHDSARDSDLFI